MTFPFPWPWFKVTVKHDHGKINIYTPASSEEHARGEVMAAERCPARSILKVRQLKRKPKWL